MVRMGFSSMLRIAHLMCGGVQKVSRGSGTVAWRGGSPCRIESAWMMLHFKDFRPRLRAFLPVVSAPALDRPPVRASLAEIFDDAKLPLLVSPPRGVQATDVGIGDWNDLLCAVKDRLTLIVRSAPHATTERPLRDQASWVQAGVLDCVAALDQLHSTLTHELARCREVEREAFEARIASAQAREELFGTRAGERRARHLALHDSLTLLPNRSCFHERLGRALTQPDTERRALAVLFLDLDGFKDINDSHGHAVGDEVLKIVAARLTRALRAEDTVSRVGGDEFACLLAEPAGRDELSRLVSSLIDTVSAPVKLGELKLNLRPSIGIAVCPDDGTTCESLLRRADAAMDRAKRQQTGYAFFDHQQPET